MNSFNFSTFISPFTWRYGSKEMRQIFSEENKYRLWRKIWVALATAQKKAGLLSGEELNDLIKYQDDIDIGRILEIEKDTRHDIVAAIREFAEKAKIGGGKIHLGATSMDITDNADILRINEALVLINDKLLQVLSSFSQKIAKYADFPCLGYTHLQPAEPTTLGYRFASYAQDLLLDTSMIYIIKVKYIKGKGLKGAVGTAASYKALLQSGHAAKYPSISTETLMTGFEKSIMRELGIDAFLITSQVYPRKLDYLILTALASIAQSASKFAFDLRVMQSPGFGEWQEPFGKSQVGSSAMPFKKNPAKSENICSLARYVSTLPIVAWENASQSLLERTLDDSGNRRIILPNAFLAVDEILNTLARIVEGLIINEERIAFNLHQYAPFAATEAIIIEAVKSAANRQEVHELIRKISMKAWGQVQKNKTNPMEELLLQNTKLKKYVPPGKLKELLNISCHVGDAPQRARSLVKKIKNYSSKNT